MLSSSLIFHSQYRFQELSLQQKGHILLQFTGLYDNHGEEIYDMDVLLKDNIKYIIRWKNELNGWAINTLDKADETLPDLKNFIEKTVRLRSYFESGS